MYDSDYDDSLYLICTLDLQLSPTYLFYML